MFATLFWLEMYTKCFHSTGSSQHNMVIMEAKDAARTLSDSDFLTL